VVPPVQIAAELTNARPPVRSKMLKSAAPMTAGLTTMAVGADSYAVPKDVVVKPSD